MPDINKQQPDIRERKRLVRRCAAKWPVAWAAPNKFSTVGLIKGNLFRRDNWEVGRLVLAPEDRSSDLLPKCLALTLRKLMSLKDVQHLHATTGMLMTRLYRRFGFRIDATTHSRSGKPCALIYGQIDDVASALKISQPSVAFSEQMHSGGAGMWLGDTSRALM